jgi:death-on-curing protein
MTEPVWLELDLILLLHDEVLAETGGASGVRDFALLESALARPQNRFLYEGLVDPLELAATYAVAISGNHPFIDGNKRAAFMALGLFLDDNGMVLTATAEEATDEMLAVASGAVSIEQLTAWLQTRVVKA